MENPEGTSSPDRSSLTYEETPIIDPASGETIAPHEPDPQEKEDLIPEAARVFQPPHEVSRPEVPPPFHEPVSQPPQKPFKKKGGFHMGTVLFIFILFGLGIWLSSQLRSFFAPVSTGEVPVPTASVGSNAQASPSFAPSAPVSTASANSAQWVIYQPYSGATKRAIDGISYKLPSSVKPPVCDSSSCSSQGTNLPGGTRFTVAPRGKGQLLPDFRGAILTDTSGHEFTMKQTMVSNVYVYEYTGNFTGRTGGGYTFTKMRGVLIPVSDTLAIEFNHFAPAGSTSDFAADDVVFDQMIKTFTSTGTSSSLSPSGTTPTPATSSGYGL